MVRSTVIPNPEASVDRLIGGPERYRCVCCGGPTLPIMDWRLPGGKLPGYYICHHCVQHCKTQTKGSQTTYEHIPHRKLPWEAIDSCWAVDLRFKKLK